MTWVLVDNSYYNFYRFYATLSWYNYSQERVNAAGGVPWLENPVFMKTYEKMWFETIKKICKKFQVSTERMIFARDGNKVWRYEVYPEYKATRPQDTDDIHSPGPVFKYTNTRFHVQLPGARVIRVESAEGDDIIAITTRYLRTVQPHEKIIIITGDHDMLQLSDPENVEIYQLRAFKQITVQNPHAALMSKILAGDPSDNIPPAFKGCGKRTAARLAEHPEELEKMLLGGRKQYDLNCRLVDFNFIPEDVTREIEEWLDEILGM